MMDRPEDHASSLNKNAAVSPPTKKTSKKVTDHLANERTFLAWIRTGIALMTFGFVVARFGLLLRELGLKSVILLNNTTIHFSSIVGIILVAIGVLLIAAALLNFIQVRRDIDLEEFHPRLSLVLMLTILTVFAGIILAVYLFVTA